MTNTTLQDTLTPLAGQLAEVLAAKAVLEEDERTIKAQIRKLVPGPDTYQAGDVAITVGVNRRFDPKTATRLLPPDMLALCQVLKVDSAQAKTVLPPAIYEKCMAEVGEYRIGFARP